MSRPLPDDRLTLLAPTAITAAVTGAVGPVVRLRGGVHTLAVQAIFTYGSGGTTVKAWVQTSLDGGTTWVDVACFAFTTSSARRISVLHLATPAAANVTPSDGALADNTILDGVLGDLIRVKYISTGTYANTSLTLAALAKGV